MISGTSGTCMTILPAQLTFSHPTPDTNKYRVQTYLLLMNCMQTDIPISESVLMVYMDGDADTLSFPEPDISRGHISY